MNDYLFNIGFGYLLGLSLIGYIAVLYTIRNLRKVVKLPRIILKVLILLHYILGVFGIFYVPITFFRIDSELNSVSGGILFGLMSVGTLLLAFFIIRYFRDIYCEDK